MDDEIPYLIECRVFNVVGLGQNYAVNGIVYPTIKKTMFIDGNLSFENSYHKILVHYWYKKSAAKIYHKTVMKQIKRKQERKREITTLILCKKLCPDMDRLVSEYL